MRQCKGKITGKREKIKVGGSELFENINPDIIENQTTMKRSGYKISQTVPIPTSIFTGLLSVTFALQVYDVIGMFHDVYSFSAA